MEEMLNTNKTIYTKAPRLAARYRWWKTIPIAVVAIILLLILEIIMMVALVIAYDLDIDGLLNVVSDGYDGSDFVSVPGIALNIGTIGLILPAFFLATKMFRLPFGLWTSVAGHMRWKVLARCSLVALIFYGILIFGIPPFTEWGSFGNLQLATIIGLLVAVPLQCAAEEYLFRGFIMQTIGSWISPVIPSTIIAVLVQAAIFTSQHPYNWAGKASVAITALVYAYLAIRTGGLEAGIAVHSVNNLLSFFLAAVDVTEVSSEVSWSSTLIMGIIEVTFAIILIKIGEKRGWFDCEPYVDRKYPPIRKNTIVEVTANENISKEPKEVEFVASSDTLEKQDIVYFGGDDDLDVNVDEYID